MVDFLDPREITIPEDRQRKDTDHADLVESIRRWGILNPIVIDEDRRLIAGERRLRAALDLDLPEVPVRYLSDLSETERKVLELEENVSRKDLSWQERADAVRQIWELRGRPPHEDLAEYLGKSRAWVTKHLQAAELKETHPEITKVDSMQTAINQAKRKEARRLTAEVLPVVELDAGERFEVIQADFIEWAEQADELFNFIHVDFPYGIGLDKSGTKQGYSARVYDDSADTYFKLLGAFTRNQERFCAPDCTIIWWLNIQFLDATTEALRKVGFEPWRYPLIWAYGANVGMFPDPQRAPRHSYETAILFTRGDRPLVKMNSDCVVYNPQHKQRIHPSEKPIEVLRHFMSMFVDETTSVLDPTCGSGNAILVARDLGARRALGIELDEEYFQIAKENVHGKA